MLLRDKKNESSCEYMIIYINPHAHMHTYIHTQMLWEVLLFLISLYLCTAFSFKDITEISALFS